MTDDKKFPRWQKKCENIQSILMRVCGHANKKETEQEPEKEIRRLSEMIIQFVEKFISIPNFMENLMKTNIRYRDRE